MRSAILEIQNGFAQSQGICCWINKQDNCRLDGFGASDVTSNTSSITGRFLLGRAQSAHSPEVHQCSPPAQSGDDEPQPLLGDSLGSIVWHEAGVFWDNSLIFALQ